MVTLQCPRFCCRFAVLQAGFQGEFGGAALDLRRFFVVGRCGMRYFYACNIY
jgi:hypothetical protein